MTQVENQQTRSHNHGKKKQRLKQKELWKVARQTRAQLIYTHEGKERGETHKGACLRQERTRGGSNLEAIQNDKTIRI